LITTYEGEGKRGEEKKEREKKRYTLLPPHRPSEIFKEKKGGKKFPRSQHLDFYRGSSHRKEGKRRRGEKRGTENESHIPPDSTLSAV